MQQSSFEAVVGTMPASDGTWIGYRRLGQGPVVVILHRGMIASRQYLELGACWRRPIPCTFRIGAGAACAAPLSNPMAWPRRSTTSPACWMKRARSESLAIAAVPSSRLRQPGFARSPNWPCSSRRCRSTGRSLAAMALFQQGMRMNWVSRIPRPFLDAFLWLMLRGEDGREAFALLPTLMPDFGLVPTGENVLERYRNVAGPTLLLGGARSPVCILEALHLLAQTPPAAELRVAPNLDHSAPTTLGEPFARETVAHELLRYFA